MTESTDDNERDISFQETSGTRVPYSWERLLPRCSVDVSATAFLFSLQSRGLSNNTVMAYGRSLESFIDLFGPLTNIKFDILAVYRFLGFLRKTVSCHPGAKGELLSQATISQRLVALRSYADYLVDSQKLKSNPVPRGQVRWSPEGVPVPIRRGLTPSISGLPKIPTDEQWKRIIDAVGKRGTRDQLMLTLAYDAALRRNELVTIQLSDIDFSARELLIRPENSKSGCERRLIYSETTGHLIKLYLRERKTLLSESSNLFISMSPRNRGRSLTGYTWGAVTASLAIEAVVPHFSTHSLRHLRLTDLAKSGMDLKELAMFAGHKSTGSTMTYIHLSGRDLAPTFARASKAFGKRFGLT